MTELRLSSFFIAFVFITFLIIGFPLLNLHLTSHQVQLTHSDDVQESAYLMLFSVGNPHC